MAHATALALAMFLTLNLARYACGHPGSGIVATPQGDVFFVDNSPPPPEGTGREIVWRLGTDGKLTSVATRGGHWLAIDSTGAFARVDLESWFQKQLPHFIRVTAADFRAMLIAADGQPFVFNRDGNLYYAKGNLQLMRLTPQGKASPVLPNMIDRADKLGGIKGLACGPDGSLYLSYPSAVQKVTLSGQSSMLAEGIEAQGNQHPFDPAMPGPYLRGLAVAADGNVYAAASNSRAVLKITPDRKISTLAKADHWIPTGVAVSGNDVYVLEFDDAPPTRWRPRVRKIDSKGTVSIVATIER